MDQTEYLKAIKPIENHMVTGSKSEDQLPEPLQKKFLSLLMALAYALQTRIDLGVYVVALQRVAHEPTYAHFRKLNALVRWAQRNPLALRYNKMTCSRHLEVHSDAGFRKEEKDGVDTGRSQRGANYIRLGEGSASSSTGRPCHILDWHCSSLIVMARSTFAWEGQAAIAAKDAALMLGLTPHELHS